MGAVVLFHPLAVVAADDVAVLRGGTTDRDVARVIQVDALFPIWDRLLAGSIGADQVVGDGDPTEVPDVDAVVVVITEDVLLPVGESTDDGGVAELIGSR